MAELTEEQTQITALEKEVADQKKRAEQQESRIATQAGKIESQGKEIAGLKSTITKKDEEIVKIKSEVGEKVEEIRILKQEAEATEQTNQQQAALLKAAQTSVSTGKPVVTHEGKHYQVLVRTLALPDGRRVKAEELATNSDLVAQLVTSGSGALHLVDSAE